MNFKCPNCYSENLSIGTDNTAVCIDCRKQSELILKPVYRSKKWV